MVWKTNSLIGIFVMNIEKKMTHIWIGPNPPPKKWMDTWPEKHPDWEYSVFTDDMLRSRKWYNQELIEEYYKRRTWCGVADLIRYELIYERGGFWPEADSECLHPVDELFVSPSHHAYTVYEIESHPQFSKYVSPIMAANPGNVFLDIILQKLHALTPRQLHRQPHMTTGNYFLSTLIDEYSNLLTIFPSHYFIPQWYAQGAKRYDGPDTVYADQHWGSTGMPWSKQYTEGI